MFEISLDKYVIWSGDGTFQTIPFSIKQAKIVDIFNYVHVPLGHEAEIKTSVVAVQQYNQSPFLAVELWYWSGDSVRSEFMDDFEDTIKKMPTPENTKAIPCLGILYVAETDVLFIGVGNRTLAYNLSQPPYKCDCNEGGAFAQWRRHANYVFNEDKTSIDAWDLTGQFLWSVSSYLGEKLTYRIDGEKIHISTGERKISFLLTSGPDDGDKYV